MEKLFNKLKITPNNIQLYETSFSHSSYIYENMKEQDDYERLEFLGDAVLEVVISDYLYHNTKLNEGEMTKMRANYVCENALYQYALDYNFSDYVKVGHGEDNDGGRFKKVILADIFESLMGAIYIDLGYDQVKKVVLNIIVPYIEDPNINFFNDYKSELQEYVQTTKKSVDYQLVGESGPAHDKTFTVAVKVNNIVLGTGTSYSKKEAEQEAAKNALSKNAQVDL